MPSIVEGYNYDVFISYRQKDNKYDGWVTEFVDHLKKELEATFKEDVSIYFDENPSGGLLESHNVDKSLEDKLKCLIFIPIISQTYCDLKSFAWQNELCCFNKLAREERLGRDIRLSSGNVSSRILPVKIHDLDPEDKALLENELGGFIRSIDFIYRSAGVNRPLRVNEDHPQDNLNRTFYRDQINKVANAVKEIISATGKQLSKTEVNNEHDTRKGFRKTEGFSRIKIFTLLMSLLIVIAGIYFISAKRGKQAEKLEKSIAVLPFENWNSEKEYSHLGDAIANDISTQLSQINQFRIISYSSSSHYGGSDKPPVAQIGKELGANFIIEGTIERQIENVSIHVQVVNTVKDNQLWAQEFKGKWDDIFILRAEIAKKVAEQMDAVLSADEIKRIEQKPTQNIEAFNYFLQAEYLYWKSYDSNDWDGAIRLYQKAIDLDPSFVKAYTKCAMSYLQQFWFYHYRTENVLSLSKKMIDNAFQIAPELPESHMALGMYYYVGFQKYDKALEQFNLVLAKQPDNSEALYYTAAVYRREGKWEKAKEYFKRSLEADPRSARITFNTGETYDLCREYDEALKYYNLTRNLNPQWTYPYFDIAQLYIKMDGNTVRARKMIEDEAVKNNLLLKDSLSVEILTWINIIDGRFEDAIESLNYMRSEVFETQWYYRPKYLYYSMIYRFMNDPEKERAYTDSCRIFLEDRIRRNPDDQRIHSTLGVIYGFQGNEKRAVEESEKAVALMPVSKDSWKGVYLVENLAYTYALLGRNSEALKKIDYLLSTPGILNANIIKIDPRWSSLRSIPEFTAILEKYSSK